MLGFQRRGSAWTGLVRRFFLWYVPYFNAYSLPVIRAQEFEADDAAAAVAGKERAGSSLVKAMLASRWTEESYWPRFYRRTLHEPSPPETAFTPLTEGIVEAGKADGVGAWYRRMLEIETSPYDTHPSVAEQLGSKPFGMPVRAWRQPPARKRDCLVTKA